MTMDIPDGWKLVPKIATPSMLVALDLGPPLGDDEPWEVYAQRCWDAVLEKVPDFDG
jgi:hypothetical protein